MNITGGGASRTVRAFGPDGILRRGHYSYEQAERLAGLKLVIAQRNRKGKILCIHFYGESRMPVQNRMKPGAHYSYQEQVAGGRRRWTHSQLPRVPVEPGLGESEFLDQLDNARRAVFGGITQSVTIAPRPLEPIARTNNLVSIEAFRKPAKVINTELRQAA